VIFPTAEQMRDFFQQADKIQPETYFDSAITRCVAFRGLNKTYIIDDKAFGGPLYNQFINAMEWLHGKLDVAYDIEGQGSGPRKEIWEIPENVFKESLTNSLSHRDYYDRGATITVELFDDRVEFSNMVKGAIRVTRLYSGFLHVCTW
jgi:ATP-dependent DNA helicase RecG